MGERQRVMIARALSTEPKLVLADEPTGSLDTRRGGEVLELLSEICRERGAAVLLVTHDPQATAFADRVLALRDGRLVDYEPDECLLRSAGDSRRDAAVEHRPPVPRPAEGAARARAGAAGGPGAGGRCGAAVCLAGCEREPERFGAAADERDRGSDAVPARVARSAGL